jgi:hypothetical protein
MGGKVRNWVAKVVDEWLSKEMVAKKGDRWQRREMGGYVGSW